ncbi:LysR family transcriptional regulator [Roseospirillum parvum]|uniref:DNA-binding transcriptional regulator, LysR family n=1 Tax=Roseospirillum parvum TaxID=83401 RepID=A0A1G8CM78_9PROT|nr:LysR family transcriptional regulator [Roseospirillum parvum]SDH46409.1 DNA-binding transcriptional regulator, LysR family [Roseospirillum parvum]
MPIRQGNRLDWDKLRVFHAVAEAGSFTHAGERLGLSQSAVSRQISGLEESLAQSLFHRHARGLILTEQGDLLYQTVHEVFTKLALVETQLTESRERPTGPLKVTTTVAFGSVWLAPRVKHFIQEYPEIDLTLILNDGELDLAMREADVAVRFMAPRQPDLVKRVLRSISYNVYAAPDYLRKYGTPQTIEDMADHKVIIYGDEFHPPVENMNWFVSAIETAGVPVRPVLRVNNIYSMYRAVQSGLGLAALPAYLSQEDTNLVRVLPQMSGDPIEIYFVYPEEMRHLKRVEAFRDFLMRQMSGARARLTETPPLA